jgi:hypothetical protein
MKDQDLVTFDSAAKGAYSGKIKLGVGAGGIGIEFIGGVLTAELFNKVRDNEEIRWIVVRDAEIPSGILQRLIDSVLTSFSFVKSKLVASDLADFLMSSVGHRCTGLTLNEVSFLNERTSLEDCCDRLPTYPNLEYCEVSAMPIGQHMLHWLAGCPKLIDVFLTGALVEDSDLEMLSSSRSIVVLGIDYTEVGNDGIERVASIPTLERLSINFTRATDGVMQRLAEIPRLERLYIQGLDVSSQSLKNLGARLKTLDLDFRQTAIKNSEWLEALLVYGYGVPQESLDAFRKAGGSIAPWAEEDEGGPCYSHVILANECGDAHLAGIAAGFPGKGNSRIEHLEFHNSQVSPEGWFSAMGKIWGNASPIIHISKLDAPEEMVRVISMAVSLIPLADLRLCIRAEQLTPSLIRSLDAYEDNNVEIGVVSGEVNRALVDLCRRSKTIKSLECGNDAVVLVPQELIDDISKG